MKEANTLALLTFGLAVIFSGGNYPSAVQTGASWGFWICAILGSIIAIISTVIVLAGGTGGAAAMGSAGGPLGGIIGGILGLSGAALIMAVAFTKTVILIIITCAGYSAMGKWGASGLEDKVPLIMGCVLLGISLFFGYIKKKT